MNTFRPWLYSAIFCYLRVTHLPSYYVQLRTIACAIYLLSHTIFVSAVWAETNPEITITGGTATLHNNIHHYLSLADEKCSAPLWRLQSLLGEAQEEIKLAAQAVGYYQLTFTTKLTQNNNCWQLHIDLMPGALITVSELRVLIHGEGANDDIFKPIYETPDIKIGDTLNHGRYENLKNRILTMASSHGYYDGRFEVANIQINTADNTAAIDLIYDSGQRYHFGEIYFTHNILAEKFLQRYLNFNSGDYYDTDKLLELKNLYNASNYFKVATATPDIQHLTNHQVPIDVVLEERKRRAYSYGVGITTDTGPRVLLGFEDRYVNDSGHSITADMSASTIKTNALVAYSIPMQRPAHEFFKIYTGFENEEIDVSTTKNKKLGASYTYYQRNHWLHTYAVDFENENSRIGDEPLSTTNLLIPSATFSRTQTDGQPYPLTGWRLLGKLSGSPKTLGSDLSYIQLYAQGKFIHALPLGRLLLRTELGATQMNDFDELPVTKRFLTGGDTSVRGYSYKSLGGPLIDGKVMGGNNLWVGSIEYDYLIRPRWALATFYDIGNAADDFHAELKSGAGIGVRWISPIGPMRIDIARALDESKSWHLHITMGPDL